MKTLSCGLLLLTLSAHASASVVMNNTRVIFPSDKEIVNVQLINKSAEGHLVQSWVDNGNPNEKPENLKLPLAVVPAVVKIGAGDGQILTVVKSNLAAALPADRETLFWLNFIDIPPQPKDKRGNFIQFAVRNRVKVFYRPAALNVRQIDVQNHLQIKREGNNACVNNSSPYFITAAGLSNVQKGSQKDNLLKKTLLIKPFSCAPLDNSIAYVSKKQTWLTYLDDFGTLRTVSIPVI